MQGEDACVAGVGGDLGDTDVGRAEGVEGVDEIALVEGLERPGDHRAALDVQAGGAVLVVGDGERVGQVAVVGHQRVGGVDDVQVGVEDGLGHR